VIIPSLICWFWFKFATTAVAAAAETAAEVTACLQNEIT